jgi:predicted ribosome quality control (RQC) complex YloA/Tae2 family protein
MSVISWDWKGLLEGEYLRQIASDMASFSSWQPYEWLQVDQSYILKLPGKAYLFDLDPFIATAIPLKELPKQAHAPINFPGPRRGTIESIQIQGEKALILLTQSEPTPKGWLLRLCARIPNLVWIDESLHSLKESHFQFALDNLQPAPAKPLSQEVQSGFYEQWKERKEALEIERKKEAIRKHFENEFHQLDTRLKKLQNSLERAPDPQALKDEAQLLQAYHHHFTEADSIQVWDWIHEQEIILKKPAGNIQEHISGLFQKAKGYEKHQIVLSEQIRSIKTKQTQQLQAVDYNLLHLILPQDKSIPKSTKIAEPLLKGLRRFEYKGALFLVGKTSKDNMTLSFKIAHGNDLWLHVADHPGSHVVIKALKEDVNLQSPQILEIGSLLAHHFSSARKLLEVDVTWAQAKWVKKIPGAKTGTVGLVQSYHTYSRQNPELLAQILALA